MASPLNSTFIVCPTCHITFADPAVFESHNATHRLFKVAPGYDAETLTPGKSSNLDHLLEAGGQQISTCSPAQWEVHSW
jgi:hypothetical protein